jgi:hypothetical protein
MLRFFGSKCNGVEPFLGEGFPLVKLENVGCDQVADWYGKQDANYVDDTDMHERRQSDHSIKNGFRDRFLEALSAGLPRR